MKHGAFNQTKGGSLMRRFTSLFVSVVVFGLAWLIQATENGNAELPAAYAPRILTVLVGGGQDTAVLDGFFPRTIRVRVGDTVTWKLNSDPNLRHTVTFVGGSFQGPKDPVSGGEPGEIIPGRWVPVPGGSPGELMRNPVFQFPTRRPGAPVESYDGTAFVSAGELSIKPRPGLNPNETFSVTFTKPGTYHYVCLIHRPHMVGIVEVVPATVTDVPDQAEIDKQAKAEMAHLLALMEKGKEQTKALRSLPGPNGTTLWFVRAGAFELSGAELRGQAHDFQPKNLTIKAGDTVIWEAVDGHTITFIPAPPAPEVFLVKPQADRYPLVIQNPKVFRPAKPAAIYDPAQHFNSAPIGQTSPRGTSWALTFDTPGVYEYICAFHHETGMKGTITVVER